MTTEDSAAALDTIIDSAGIDIARNEAQTRFDLIDRVLREVLGWGMSAIRVEQSASPGYTDYELGETGTVMIVEAKREGASFVLPTGLDSGVHSIEPIVRDPANKELRDAMQQVMQYCSVRGVSPAVVTNGHQWVAFLASRSDGVPPLRGKALFFSSLESVREKLLTAWNNLSPQAVASRALFATLSVSAAAPPLPLSASLRNYPGIKQRNALQSNLQILGQLMLEDIPTSEVYSELFLKECYATSGALSSYAEVSKEILSSRDLLLTTSSGMESEPVETKKGINPTLTSDMLSAAMSHRPIVLLGGVGVGKSTFIQHLIHVDAKSVFQDALSFIVDFGRGATLEDPAAYTVSEIDRQLRSLYGIEIDSMDFVEDLYRSELKSFDRGIYGQLKSIDPQQYLLKRIEHLGALLKSRPTHLSRALHRITSSHRRQIVVFLDNVDQRSKEDQNKVFLVSNELAANWPATVFVTLRPETFYESERYGAVSGYHPRVFTIAPPRTDVMLKKRVDFAISILETRGDVDGTGTESGVVVESDNLLHFLRMLSRNFSDNHTLMAMIDNLAGGNMRRALDFITEFIGSGHVDTKKIITIESTGSPGYTIPQHEFLRSLLHGDGIYYDPEHSPIPNLFQLDRPDMRGHFLMMIILDYVSRKGEARDQSGYVSVSAVITHLQSLGFPVDSIMFALEYCSRFRLLEFPLSDSPIRLAEKCRVTTVGAYSVRRLPQLFTYVDAVVVDTPIVDQLVAAEVRDEFDVVSRLTRAQVIRAYLDAAWAGAGIPPEVWDWGPISAELLKDIDGVRGRVARTAEKTGR